MAWWSVVGARTEQSEFEGNTDTGMDAGFHRLHTVTVPPVNKPASPDTKAVMLSVFQSKFCMHIKRIKK